MKLQSEKLKKDIYFSYIKGRNLTQKREGIISKIQNDIPLLESEYYQEIINCFVDGLSAIVAFAFVIHQNVFYALFCFLMMCIPIVLSKGNIAKVDEMNSGLKENQQEYTTLVNKIEEGKTSIFQYHLMEVVLGVHGGVAGMLAKRKAEKNAYFSKLMIRNQNTNRAVCFLALLVGFYLVSQGKMTVGWVMAFSQLSSSMTYTLIDAVQDGIKAYGCRRLKKELLEYAQDAENETETETIIQTATENTTATKDAGLKARFGLSCDIKECSIGDVTILRGIQMELKAGEKAMILGENGAGKSTLFKILLGLNPQYQGKVEWTTQNGEIKGAEEMRRNIAYIPQKPFLFPDTVKSNILLGQPEDESRYKEIKKKLKIRLEDDKVLNNREENVSGGEKQKIELARALYSGRKVLLLDEPYSALDQSVLQTIEEEILKRKDLTVITISHVRNQNQALYTKKIYLEKPRSEGKA